MSSADSPGPSTSPPEPVLIFDLDGTLLSVNSFPYWVKYLLYGSFSHLTMRQRLCISLRAAGILAQRKLLRHGHAATKRRFQRLWSEATRGDDTQSAAQRFAQSLLPYVRPNLRRILQRHGGGALLATSAASDYAQRLGETLGFAHILATPPAGDADDRENSRETKRDRTLRYLAAQGWDARARLFFTDHEEDLPLARACALTLWFGDDASLAAAKALAPDLTIVSCRHASDGDMETLIAQFPDRR